MSATLDALTPAPVQEPVPQPWSRSLPPWGTPPAALPDPMPMPMGEPGPGDVEPRRVDRPVPERPLLEHPVPERTLPERSLSGRPLPDRLVGTGRQQTTPTPAVGGQPPRSPRHDEDLRGLIAALTSRSAELFGVSDTAQVLADDLVERAAADAAAVLVPDGSLWRVSGSVGLLPPERQITLDATHWLITEIALAGQVLLLQDTVLARPKLAGAPLATWRHLLAVPVPQVRALVMLARGPASRPFSESDLAGLVGPISEAAGLLATAQQTRELARLLVPLTETEHPPDS